MAKPSRVDGMQRSATRSWGAEQSEPTGQIAQAASSFRGIDLSVGGEILLRHGQKTMQKAVGQFGRNVGQGKLHKLDVL
jgi:hypothetical protein